MRVNKLELELELESRIYGAVAKTKLHPDQVLPGIVFILAIRTPGTPSTPHAVMMEKEK